MLFIQVSMVVLSIIAFISLFFNVDDAIYDRGKGRYNIAIGVLLCILMGLGAYNVSEYRDNYNILQKQSYALTKKVEGVTMRLEKQLNETIKLTQNVQKLQNALEKEQREKADIDAQLNTAHSALVVANDKIEKIQKLISSD